MAEKVKDNSQQDQAPLVHLPTEILIMIMRCSVNFTSLWSLINTSSRLNLIFMTAAQEIVGYIMTETTPICLRHLMKIVLVTRTLPNSLLHIKDVVKYMSGETILEPFQQEVSSQVLRDFVELVHNIHSVAFACLDFCIEKTKTMKPRRLTDSELERIHNLRSSPRRIYDELQGQSFQPKYSGPPSYLEEQMTVRILWRLQTLYELKAACSIGALAHWPEGDQKYLRIMTMPDLLQMFRNRHCRWRSRLEKSQFDTIVNFASQIMGRQTREMKDELSGFLQRPPAAVYDRGYHLPCFPKPDPVLKSILGREELVDVDSEIELVPAGYRFWMNATNASKSPLRYTPFKPYRKFGFAFWQAERMTDLGFLESGDTSERNPWNLYFVWRSVLIPDEIPDDL